MATIKEIKADLFENKSLNFYLNEKSNAQPDENGNVPVWYNAWVKLSDGTQIVVGATEDVLERINEENDKLFVTDLVARKGVKIEEYFICQLCMSNAKYSF